jgi:hypothetical protein
VNHARPPSGPSNSFKIFTSRTITFLQTVGVCNLFRIHTSEPSCKCGKQETYRIAKFFRCNTYKKGGRGSRLSNSDPPFPAGFPLSPISYPLFPFFSHSCALFCAFLQFFALFCTSQRINSLVFKRFRTLCTKHPGVGEGLKKATIGKEKDAALKGRRYMRRGVGGDECAGNRGKARQDLQRPHETWGGYSSLTLAMAKVKSPRSPPAQKRMAVMSWPSAPPSSLKGMTTSFQSGPVTKAF